MATVDDNALLGRLTQRLGLSLAADQLEALLERLRRRPQQLELLEEAAALAGAAPFSTSPTARYEVRGSVAPGYEAVREAFESNFASGWERDAQLCVYHRGARVVDLWGSSAEPGFSMAPAGGAYDAETLQIIYSSTK